MALHQKRRKCLYDKYLSISNAHDMVLKKSRMEMQDNSGGERRCDVRGSESFPAVCLSCEAISVCETLMR